MKKLFFATTVFACGLALLAGCTKSLNPTGDEPSGNETTATSGRIQLTTEGYKGDTKSSVQNTSVLWDNGDKVNINGTEYTVTVDGESAYIDGSSLGSGELKAHYPSGVLSGNTLTFPGNYTSTMVEGVYQSIALPMVAYDPAEAEHKYLHFYHASAAVQVMLWNTMTDRALHVDRVVIRTEQYAVSGSCTIDPTNPSQAIAPVAATSDSERQVVVDFPDFDQGGELILDANAYGDQRYVKSIQVPFRPIGADDMTIEVYCRDGYNNKYRYSYTQSCPALTRNQMVTARVKLDLNGHMVQMVDLSALTGDYESQDGVVLTGTLSRNHMISIADGAHVTLAGVSINADGTYTDIEHSGITCRGDATITLAGGTINTVRSFEYEYSGIQAGPAGTTLTINGTGTLNAYAYNAAAIGGISHSDCGNITIEGGIILADCSGDNNDGTGIGAGNNYKCGNITISGGHVTAIAGSYGAAGIGTSGNHSTCGDILISGGTIIATGSNDGPGIGAGYDQGKCGRITIETGITSVTATRGSNTNTGDPHNSRDYIDPCIGAVVPGAQNNSCGYIYFGTNQMTRTKITSYPRTSLEWNNWPTSGSDYGGLHIEISNEERTWTLTPSNP